MKGSLFGKTQLVGRPPSSARCARRLIAALCIVGLIWSIQTTRTIQLQQSFWKSLDAECLYEFQKELRLQHSSEKMASRHLPLLASIIPQQGKFIFVMTHLKEDYNEWYGSSWYCSSSTTGRNTSATLVKGHDPHCHSLIMTCPSQGDSDTFEWTRIQVRYKKDDSTYSFNIPSNLVCSWEMKQATVSACTMVKYKESFLQVPEWVAYHSLIGIEQFYFYVNDDIHRVPSSISRHQNNVHWIPFQDSLKHDFFLQQAMQNDCIHRARNKSEWVALFDVDEYFQFTSNDNHSNSLPHFLKQQQRQDIGGMRAKNWFFGAHDRHHALLPGDPLPTSDFILDKYIYRDPNYTLNRRQKMIVQPNNVEYFSVHMITRGGNTQDTSELRLNHYKLPSNGVYGYERNQTAWPLLVRDMSMRKFVAPMQARLEENERR